MNKKIVVYLLFVMCLCLTFSITKPTNISDADAVSEIVMETTSHRVVYENNIHAKKYMASTTKILTAITVIENCDIEEEVTVTEQSIGIEGSSIYLEAGEKLSVKDLLYGLMLRSGNDCAETLALHISGSINNFADLMNKTAEKIGCKNSNFVNPHGLHSDNHYTTAYDLALIAVYAMKNPVFRQIVSSKSYTIPFTTRNTKRVLINKNRMLKEFYGATGIKTGFTKKAGRCLVSSCKRNGMEFVCVVLNCPSMFERSKELLTNSFNKYSLYKLVESDNVIDFIEQSETKEKLAVYIKNDITLPLTEEEFKTVKTVYELPKSLPGNVTKNDIIGFIKIYYQNNLLFTEKIYTMIP